MRLIWVILVLCWTELTLCAEKKSAWPHSESNQYEIIGHADLGFLIPLPDFRYKSESIEHRFYEHVIYTHRELAVTIEGFNLPTPVKQYADGYTKSWKKDNPSIRLLEEKEIIAGTNVSTPMIRRTWKLKGETIHQLYFVKDRLGVCLTAFCDLPSDLPKEIIEQENRYWSELLDELAGAVEFFKGQAKIVIAGR